MSVIVETSGGCCEHGNEILVSVRGLEFLGYQSDYCFSRRAMFLRARLVKNLVVHKKYGLEILKEVS
jgi:hypothetical protein